MPVEKRFIVNLKGKEFVMLGGLLQLAHEQGIRSIETNLVMELCNPAENRFVVQAIGTFPAKESGEPVVWSAYGDASPANSQMKGAELRHAETRAIARMLRWATNCPTTAFEELGPDTDEAPNGERGHRNAQEARTARSAPPSIPKPVPTPPAASVASSATAPVICDEVGCGVVLSADEQRASLHHWPTLPPVCTVHGRARKDRLKAHAAESA